MSMTVEEALEVLGYLLGHEKAVDSGELEDVQNCLNSQEQEALSVILSEFRELKEKATERHFDEDALDGYGYTCTNKTCAERIRAKAIDEFLERLCTVCCGESMGVILGNRVKADMLTVDGVCEIAYEIAEAMKGE